MAEFTGPERRLDIRATITLSNGTQITLQADDVYRYSVNSSACDSGLPVGGAISASFTLGVAAGALNYSAVELDSAEVRVQIGTRGDADKYTYFDAGCWYVTNTETPEQTGEYTLTGMDALGLYFDVTYTDGASAYPRTMGSLLELMCTMAGVQVTSAAWLNKSTAIATMPRWPEETTTRDIVGYIAACAGGFARINNSGVLEIVSPGSGTVTANNPTIYTQFTPQGGANFDFNCLRVTFVAASEDETQSEPVRFAVNADVADNATTCIEIAGNPLYTEAIAASVKTALTGKTFEGGTVSWLGDPRAVVGLGMDVTALDSTTHHLLITSSQLDFNTGGLLMISTSSMPTLASNTSQHYSSSGRVFDDNGRLDTARIIDFSGSVVDAVLGKFTRIVVGDLQADSLFAQMAKIVNMSVSHLDAGVIDADKIKAGSITADQMKAKTITAESGILADGVVGTAQIADSSITSAKIVSLNADVITAGTLSVKRLILVGDDGLIYNINATASGLTAEELTDEKYQNQINGTVIVAKSITAAQIAAESITGNEILAQSITAGNIDVAGLFADEATINAINAMDISSNNYLKLMVETAVDDVQVGGRNYLLGTGEAYVAESDGSARTWLFPWKCASADIAHSLYGKTVTVSFDYDQAITSGSFMLQFHNTWGAVKIFNAGTASGQRFEGTFDLPIPDTFADGNPDVVIYIDGTWNGSVTFRNLKLEIGNKATDWTPAPEDGYKTSYIEIRDDHVDIGTGGTFRVNSGDVDISTSKFSVSITDEAGGEDELLTIDATGVRAANLSAPNVAQRYDGPGQIIVNSGATNAQVESGGYARSIQEVFDRINDRFLPYTLSVTVQTDTYENLSLHGVFGGAAALLIDGGSHRVYGSFSMESCHLSRINVENLGVYCNSVRNVVEVWNCTWVRLADCLVEGYSTATSAFYIDQGSAVMLYNDEMYNCSRGIYAGWGTNVDFHTLKGTCSGLYLEAYGTRITGNQSRPSGGWSGFNIISNFADMTTIPIDNGSGVVAPTTGSATFNPSATGTYTTYWWSGDSDIRQGYTKSNGRIKGGIFYAVSGVSGTVKSAILKLTRLKNYGKGSAVQVKVYGTTSTGKSGNPALSTEGYVLGTIDGGQTADFALPEALATGLGNGTYKGIVLYADDTTVLRGKTYSTNYARFTTAAPLTITWTT